jgi:RNA polymerase sigma factor (sigma-70 family)
VTEPSQGHVDALRRGDTAAWNAVVRWLQPQLDGYFIAGRATDHEALTQETLLRMSRYIDRFTDGGAHELRAWAFAIARTTRIDEARRASARPDTVPASERSADGGGTVETADATDDHVEEIAALDRVASLLDQLTEQQAELLQMRIIGDVALEHAAQVLGMELGAAKQLQRRAVRRLASILADEDTAVLTPGDDPRDERGRTRGRPTSGTPP